MEKKIRNFVLLLIVVVLVISAAYAESGKANPIQSEKPTELISVTTQPPPPKEEIKPSYPGEKYIWAPGCWKWNGRKWRWIAGYWKRKKEGYNNWVPGKWQKREEKWIWIPGYWE